MILKKFSVQCAHCSIWQPGSTMLWCWYCAGYTSSIVSGLQCVRNVIGLLSVSLYKTCRQCCQSFIYSRSLSMVGSGSTCCELCGRDLCVAMSWGETTCPELCGVADGLLSRSRRHQFWVSLRVGSEWNELPCTCCWVVSTNVESLWLWSTL